MTIEFNLLYRWHSLVPDEIGDGRERAWTATNSSTTTRSWSNAGSRQLITQCSRDPAGKIGLHNTPSLLMGPLAGIPAGSWRRRSA